ncbi:hypothetical protein [Streptomyces sp. NPDC101165]|uniref:hypothetical protein n=1 Tax=Streptomyces sp. NPDC101165 TaxID=3366119 RepID=UPI0038040340
MNGEDMSMDAVRAASQMVGRRTTLRYLAIGVGASLLAACKGNDKAADDNKGGDNSSGVSGVTGRAFASFVHGSWKVTSQSPGASGETHTYSAIVDDGVFTLDFGGGKTAKGTWSLQGGRLALRAPERLGDDSGELHDAAAENVPATVGDTVSVGLPWQPPGESGTGSGQRLEVDYNKKAGVRIRHFDASGSMTIHQCIRA